MSTGATAESETTTKSAPRRGARFGPGGAFECGGCGKLTRETPETAGSSAMLCRACNADAAVENNESDGHVRHGEFYEEYLLNGGRPTDERAAYWRGRDE